MKFLGILFMTLLVPAVFASTTLEEEERPDGQEEEQEVARVR